MTGVQTCALPIFCAAAGISVRGVDARALAWSLAPAINASGRMAHPERALALLLADEGPTARELAQELWDLNMSRREVEQRVTQQAIEIMEAFPPATRDAPAIVVAGEGWHEGVVGIVASRLVDRFGRPAIVVSIDGDVAKGSGRSLPGIDLHALVAAASAPLQRWGGHAGAVGLQLAAADIAGFREGFAAAAESIVGAIARARIRVVDAVVGVRDLTLPTAEAFEALQPFGNGNPDVLLVVPGCVVEAAGTMGEGGRHLQLRLRAGGAHTRALGWGMGERSERVAVGERHDVIVGLAVDRWQELVGPRVTIEAVEPLGGSRPLPAQCAQPCDVHCPDRFSPQVVHDLTTAPWRLPEPPVAGSLLGIRDRRGEGAIVSSLAALAGADRGVAAVVADVARRRAILADVLAPDRLGVEVAVLGGGRCDADALRARLAQARDRPAFVLVEYASLPQIDLPNGLHIALVDPPADAETAAWARASAAGRWLHLLWGDEEAAFALAAAERDLELRPVAADIWRALPDGAELPWGPQLDRALLGDADPVRSPLAVGRALTALAEIGRIAIAPSGVRRLPCGEGPNLDCAPTAVASRERLEAARAFISRADALSFDAPAVSLSNARAVG